MRLRVLEIAHIPVQESMHPVWMFIFDEVSEEKYNDVRKLAASMKKSLTCFGCIEALVFDERVDLDTDLSDRISIVGLGE